jgi:hypothetical protein
MKVLRKGSNWTKEVVCNGSLGIPGCGSLLLVAEEDLYQVYFGDENGYGRAFKCPECSAKNYFGYEDLPAEVFSRTDRLKPYREHEPKKPQSKNKTPPTAPD